MTSPRAKCLRDAFLPKRVGCTQAAGRQQAAGRAVYDFVVFAPEAAPRTQQYDAANDQPAANSISAPPAETHLHARSVSSAPTTMPPPTPGKIQALPGE